MGNAHPSVFPYEPFPTADADLIVIAANDRQFQRLCEALGIPEVAEDERFLRNGDRTEQPRRAAAAARGAAGQAPGRRSGSTCCSRPACRAGRSTPSTTASPTAERFGLEPVVEVGEGDRALPTTRHPIRFSGTPVSYTLPPPELDEHGAELRAWLGEAAS